eukprot:10883267-Alexandrium_andersonii.AAC.1
MGHPERRCTDARGERRTQRDIPRRTPHATRRPKCGCTDAGGERHARRGIPSADALMPEVDPHAVRPKLSYALVPKASPAETLVSEANAPQNGAFQVQMH